METIVESGEIVGLHKFRLFLLTKTLLQMQIWIISEP
jgi:hypothetical protein